MKFCCGHGIARPMFIRTVSALPFVYVSSIESMRIPPSTLAVIGLAAAMIFASVLHFGGDYPSSAKHAVEYGRPAARRLDRHRSQVRHKSSSHQQRPRRAQIIGEEEEPYDPYLGLLAPEAVHRGMQAAGHSISMSMSLSLPTNAPSKVPTPSPSSPCGLDGIWEPAEDVCELMVIAGGDVQGVCNQNDQLEFYTDPIGTTGTLKGVKRRMSQDGTIESVNLIGFYHEEDCSFSAVSTTTDMTIKGKVYSRQHMQVDETEPGRSGVAITQSGKFKHTGDVTQVPSKAPTLSPSTSNPTKAPTQSPSSQPSKVRNGL